MYYLWCAIGGAPPRLSGYRLDEFPTVSGYSLITPPLGSFRVD